VGKQYTNTVIKMTKKILKNLLNGAIIWGRLRLRPPVPL